MLSIFVTNLGRYNEGDLIGEWLVLPCTTDMLEGLLHRIGINKNYEEWFIIDYSCNLDCVCKAISEFSSIEALNCLAERLEEMEYWELKKLEAVAECEGDMGTNSLLNLTYSLDCFNLYSQVNTHEELGKYFFYELSAIEIPEHLIRYFDFEAYGRNIYYDLYGTFTSYGYVEQVDDVVDSL